MAEPFDPAGFVPLAAAAVGLKLAPEDFGSVVGAFAVLARVASAVMAFPLPEEIVAANVFMPGDVSRPDGASTSNASSTPIAAAPNAMVMPDGVMPGNGGGR